MNIIKLNNEKINGVIRFYPKQLTIIGDSDNVNNNVSSGEIIVKPITPDDKPILGLLIDITGTPLVDIEGNLLIAQI